MRFDNLARESIMSTMRTGVLLCVLLAASVSASTTCTLTGRVVDGWTGEPLVGASVVIGGTAYGAPTDSNGMYLVALPETAGTAIACHAGYDDVSTRFAIAPDCTTRLDFRLYIVPTKDLSRAAESVLVCHLNLDTLRAETVATALSTDDTTVMSRGNRVRRGLLECYAKAGPYRVALMWLPDPLRGKKDLPPRTDRPYAEVVVGDSFSFYRKWYPRIAANAGGFFRTYEVTSMTAGYIRVDLAGKQEFVECRETHPKDKWLVLKLALLNGETVYF